MTTSFLPQLQSLTLEQKAAQLIMIDVQGTTLTPEEEEHVRRAPWNGVILFARNVASREQVTGLIHRFHDLMAVAPTLTVDQEGGLVDRIRLEDSVLTPGNMALAATGDPDCTRRAHRIMGQQLRQLGIHLDFSPCLDVNNNPNNPIIGVRSFGEDPAAVARHGQAAIQGLREGGIGATAKHFPGHGDTTKDSHIALPTVGHSRERLLAVELAPFRAAIEANVAAIMSAHITFPAFDPRPGVPATLSEPILTGLLREEMGFSGLIFTDSLAMHAITNHFGLEEAAVRSVEAGADVLIACGTLEEHERCRQALVQAVQQGRLSESRLDASLERIARFKQEYHFRPSAGANADYAEQRQEMESIVNRTITLSREASQLPLQGRVLILTPDLLPLTPLGEMTASGTMTQYLQLPGLEVSERTYPSVPEGPALGQLCEEAAAADSVVLCVYGRDRLTDGVRRLGERLIEANPRLVLVSLSSPYLVRDLPQARTCLFSYNYTPLSMKALGEVLGGTLRPSGQAPVTLS